MTTQPPPHTMVNTVVMHIGDVRDVLDGMIARSETFDFSCQSPPFLALRSYLPADHVDKHREIGSEPTPAAFLDTAFGWTAQLGALLPEWASICVELGDTMSGSGGAGGDYNINGLREGQPTWKQNTATARTTAPTTRSTPGTGAAAAAGQPQSTPAATASRRGRPDDRQGYGGAADRLDMAAPGTRSRLASGAGWPLEKSMCLIPHSYTFGLIYGHNPITGAPSPAGRWRVRNVIAWARPNPPVGSLGKRNPHARTGDYKFRPATSYITVACRGTGRYFDLDAVRTEGSANTHARLARGVESRPNDCKVPPNGSNRDTLAITEGPAGAPPLDWHTDQLDGDWLWKLATAPYRGSHYATFPLTLPRRLIQAMCPLRVCTVCGWPSERITGEAAYVNARTREPVTKASWIGVERLTQGAIGRDNGALRSAATVGWTDCGHGDAWRPGRVIDVFGGSGTTAVAAALEQRDAVIIDIDRRNVDLVRRRLAETVRIVSEVVDGDTVTWVVDQAAPNQRDQTVGQTNLLDLMELP